MKVIVHFTITVLSIWILNPSALFAAELSSGDKQFLTGYEQVRTALASDDLGAAQKTAAPLGEPGAAIANSKSLEEARTAFAALSGDAIKLAAGQPGYYVLHCSMVNKDWVQTSKQPSNPFAGKSMAACGVVKQ